MKSQLGKGILMGIEWIQRLCNIKRHLLNIIELSEDMYFIADVSGDGVIDSRDYTLMKDLY